MISVAQTFGHIFEIIDLKKSNILLSLMAPELGQTI